MEIVVISESNIKCGMRHKNLRTAFNMMSDGRENAFSTCFGQNGILQCFCSCPRYQWNKSNTVCYESHKSSALRLKRNCRLPRCGIIHGHTNTYTEFLLLLNLTRLHILWMCQLFHKYLPQLKRKMVLILLLLAGFLLTLFIAQQFVFILIKDIFFTVCCQ